MRQKVTAGASRERCDRVKKENSVYLVFSCQTLTASKEQRLDMLHMCRKGPHIA